MILELKYLGISQNLVEWIFLWDFFHLLLERKNRYRDSTKIKNAIVKGLFLNCFKNVFKYLKKK